MSTNVNILDLFWVSLKAHKTYVCNRIDDGKDKKDYLWIVEGLENHKFTDLDHLITYANEYVKVLNKQDEPWLRFKSRKKYKLLALDHTLDIATNLDTRFVKGWTKDYIV